MPTVPVEINIVCRECATALPAVSTVGKLHVTPCADCIQRVDAIGTLRALVAAADSLRSEIILRDGENNPYVNELGNVSFRILESELVLTRYKESPRQPSS